MDECRCVIIIFQRDDKKLFCEKSSPKTIGAHTQLTRRL